MMLFKLIISSFVPLSQLKYCNVYSQNAFIDFRVRLGRDWRWHPQVSLKNSSYVALLRAFADEPTAPFGLHKVALTGAATEGKAVGTWLGPNTISQVFK